MRILILGDMEGAAGISRWEHVLADKPLYEEGRKLYTNELNAAIRGVKTAGAGEITVVDTHGAGGARSFNSIVREDLESGCRYCTQYRWLDFEPLLQNHFDAALIIGMHSMAGTAGGVLAHTVSYDSIIEVKINGKPVGETALLSAFCAHYGCPIVFISGDRATCREAVDFLEDSIVTAAVKEGLDKFTAVHMTPKDACDLIEAKAAEALQSHMNVPLYNPSEPCEVEVQFTSPEIASIYVKLFQVERPNSCGIKYISDTSYDAIKKIFA